MNLATRCPSCATVFRVGADQLLSSEGWVRCGRCHGVFDATEVLFDIETGAPMLLSVAGFDAPPAVPGAAVAAPGPLAAPVPAGPQGRATPEIPARPLAPATPWPDADPLAARGATLPPSPEDAPFEALLRAPSRADDPPPTRQDADEPIVITDHVPPPAAPAPLAGAAAGAGAANGPSAGVATPAADDGPVLLADAAPPPVDPEPVLAPASALPIEPVLAADTTVPPAALPAQATPSFLRQAERGRLARHPAMRAAAVAGLVLLALAMPLQMAVLWRDSLAAHLPAATPALQALCRVAGCSVQPLRRIQQLAVASSGLNRVEGAPLYQLQLVLNNRADTAVMLPAVDLTLTDPQGQLLARRVLAGADLGDPPAALQPGQELPIKLLLSTGDRPVGGYTLELFYP